MGTVVAMVQRLRDLWAQYSVLLFMKRNMAVTRKIPKTINCMRFSAQVTITYTKRKKQKRKQCELGIFCALRVFI